MTHPSFLAVQFEPSISGRVHALTLSERNSRRTFVGVMIMLFVASTAVTVIWCNSMAAMGGMPMPGGWTMSMVWMRMPGDTWAGAASSFLGMWIVMMVAMMLPSLAPALDRFRRSIPQIVAIPRGRLTTLAGLGYFFVWTLFGFVVFPAGVVLANVEMQKPAFARVVPVAVGLVVLLAGGLQFTRWKAHHLFCCRKALGYDRSLPADAGTALRQGLRLGLHCSLSCTNLTALLLVIGVMDLRAMLAVATAVTAERVAPCGEVVARAIGAIALAAGCIMVIRAIPFA